MNYSFAQAILDEIPNSAYLEAYFILAPDKHFAHHEKERISPFSSLRKFRILLRDFEHLEPQARAQQLMKSGLTV